MIALLNLMRANPIRIIGIAISISAIMIIGLLSWRLNSLSDKLSSQKSTILQYKTTISQLQDSVELINEVSMADRDDTIANEIEHSKMIGVISEQEDFYGCSDIVNNTIDWVRDNTTASKNN